MSELPPPVEVRTAAHPAALPILRTLTETFALQHDFTLDSVADMRLAIDEACSESILAAAASTSIGLRLEVVESTLRVDVSSVSHVARLPSENSFGWHVLRSLTDTVVASQQPYDDIGGGYPTRIALTRRRGH